MLLQEDDLNTIINAEEFENIKFFSSIKSIGNIVSNVIFAYMERERVDNQMIF